jgi:hypothetical protein
MSRAATGDTVVRKPSNNVYTAMAAIAVMAQIIALIIVFMRFSKLFDKALFGS